MRSRPSATAFAALLAMSLSVSMTASAQAQNTNPEDENLSDQDVPAVVAPAAPADNAPPISTATPSDAPETQPLSDDESSTRSPETEAETTPQTPSTNGETVTIPKSVWEQLQRHVAELKASRAATVAGSSASAPEAPAPEASAPETPAPEAAAATSANRNYLSLPDISFILQSKGLLSSDRRDEGRTRLNLAEGELGIQGYVYPSVKADAFLVGAPAEDSPFQVEEGFLTFLGVKKGLNINVGRKFAPFGRTGELHNHSWLYPRQLLPIRNLVSEEALVGDGVNFNYLFPTKGSLFVRGSLGFFSGEGTGSKFNLGNPNDPFFGGVPSGSNAGFTKRFINARLWAGHPIGENGELEIGVSHARGTSEIADENGNNLGGNVIISGADVQYRLFMNGGKRLLLRGEYFQYQPKGGLPTRRASGYYGLANLKLNPFNDVGLLLEKSGFPQAAGSENALSLIYTRQFTEQFYARLMATHGNRPGGSYNEIRLQFTAGLGPHTHALE